LISRVDHEFDRRAAVLPVTESLPIRRIPHVEWST
jgi:hypothetical protein